MNHISFEKQIDYGIRERISRSFAVVFVIGLFNRPCALVDGSLWSGRHAHCRKGNNRNQYLAPRKSKKDDYQKLLVFM